MGSFEVAGRVQQMLAGLDVLDDADVEVFGLLVLVTAVVKGDADDALEWFCRQRGGRDATILRAGSNAGQVWTLPSTKAGAGTKAWARVNKQLILYVYGVLSLSSVVNIA